MENSMLPQLIARPSNSRPLNEVSKSDHNIRNLKRQASNLPEPTLTKRRTLAERAGEPIRSVSESSTTRSVPTIGQAGAPAFSLYRNTSATSTQSSRTDTSHSRATSQSSLTGSVGSSIRQPSGQANSGLVRPKTALAQYGASLPAMSRPMQSSIRNDRSLEIDNSKKNFDPDEPYKDFRRMFEDYKIMYQDSLTKAAEAKEESSIVKETMSRLQQERTTQVESLITLKSENETLKYRVQVSEQHLTQNRKEYDNSIEELRRQHRQDCDNLRQEHRRELDRIRNDQREELKQVKKSHEEELEGERTQRLAALSQVSTQGAVEKQRHQMDLDMKDQEIRLVKLDVEHANTALEREKELNDDLRKNLSTAGENAARMEASREALQAKIAYLESDSKSQSEAYAEMERRMNQAISKSEEIEEKLRKEETIRRRLHNQVQELKGNIRVFCRVRPTLDDVDEMARMKFPDTEDFTEIEVKGPEETSSLGKVTAKTHPFTFDRVFDPTSNNTAIFEEISQLIQSALDGYNVCIFAYGQTGSGKTYTMSSEDGMIPRALRQIYSTSKELETRGWKYSMEGSFVEVYNEEIRDLLGDGKTGKKHEVRHDMAKCETTITDVTTLDLDSQDQVESILDQAMSRRSVAATQANERSSRSHSVFILKLVGQNSITGETSKGTLNLVDLAGSERLSHSKVEGQRLKETQSINKSLSCLGDVIGALGQQQSGSSTSDSRSSSGTPTGTSHIPYRNSKLTYLLQFSLGGNSKTLMFVMVAPEKKCLGETLTSLRFAEKVAKTKVGVAKKVK